MCFREQQVSCVRHLARVRLPCIVCPAYNCPARSALLATSRLLYYVVLLRIIVLSVFLVWALRDTFLFVYIVVNLVDRTTIPDRGVLRTSFSLCCPSCDEMLFK